MIVVVAPTLIRAKQYSAGLGLADSQWRAVTDPNAVVASLEGGTAIHLLPGLDPSVVRTAHAVAARLSGRVFDHCS